MGHILLTGFLIAVTCRAVSGACFQGELKTDQAISGGYVQYCEYNKAKILVGSSFKTADCLACKCNENGFECCSFGAGFMSVMAAPIPTGCVNIARNCEMSLVWKWNWDLKCPATGTPASTGSEPQPPVSMVL